MRPGYGIDITPTVDRKVLPEGILEVTRAVNLALADIEGVDVQVHLSLIHISSPRDS